MVRPPPSLLCHLPLRPSLLPLTNLLPLPWAARWPTPLTPAATAALLLLVVSESSTPTRSGEPRTSDNTSSNFCNLQVNAFPRSLHVLRLRSPLRRRSGRRGRSSNSGCCPHCRRPQARLEGLIAVVEEKELHAAWVGVGRDWVVSYGRGGPSNCASSALQRRPPLPLQGPSAYRFSGDESEALRQSKRERARILRQGVGG